MSEFYDCNIEIVKNALETGNFQAGLKAATMAVSAKPTAEAYIYRIHCLLELNQLANLSEEFEKCQEIVNREPEISEQLANRFRNLQKNYETVFNVNKQRSRARATW